MSRMSELHAELTAATEPLDPTDGLLTPTEARALVTPELRSNPRARMALKIRLVNEANAWHTAGYPEVALELGTIGVNIPMRLPSDTPAPVFPDRVLRFQAA